MDGHEFHLLLCKYFSTVTVLLYLPHLFVYMYIFCYLGRVYLRGRGWGTTPYFPIFFILLMAYVQ